MKNLYPILLLSVCFLFNGSLYGEQKKGKVELTTSERSKLFDIKFPGGRPADLIKAIEEASGQKPNIIVSRESQDAQIPPFELASVNLDAMLDGLAMVLQTTSGTLLFPQKGHSGVNTYVFVTSFSPPTIYIKSIRDLLKKYQIEDITTAIQTAWKLENPDSDIELKFHKDTALLMSSVNSKQQFVIDAVLTQLKSEILDIQGAKQPHATAEPPNKTAENQEKKSNQPRRRTDEKR